MQVVRDREAFDVCVVGSGAGGGMAAKVLTEAGARVVMLEAGVDWDPANDSFMGLWPYDSPRRGGGTPAQQFGEYTPDSERACGVGRVGCRFIEAS